MTPENRSAPDPRSSEASRAGANVCLAADGAPNSTPSPEAQAARIEALDALRFDYIAEAFGYVASLAISAQEAANRGNAALLEIHARQTRAALVSALEVRRDLGSTEAAP